MTAVSLGKAERAYEVIRRSIETGDFRPNQELPEALLVGQLGLSRTPVREALGRLAVEGLVTLAPRATPRVTALNIHNVRQLFEYRRLIEGEAAAIVAREAGASSGVGALFHALRERFAGLPRDIDDDAFLVATEEFDRALASYVGNVYLQRQVREIRSHSVRLRAIAHRARTRREQSITDHIAMTTAIGGARPGDSRAAIHDHLIRVEQAIVNGLIEAGEL